MRGKVAAGVSVVAVIALLVSGAAVSIAAASLQATPSFHSSFVPIPQSPSSMVFDPNNGFLYVSYGNGAQGGVSVIDGTTSVANITLDSGPGPLLYDPTNHLVYAAGINGNEVAIINGTSIAGTLPTSSPVLFGFDPFSGLVYLVTQAWAGITVVNGSTIVGQLDGGCGGMANCALAFDPLNGVAYIPNSGTNTTSAFNGTSLISTIKLDGSPEAAVFDPANRLVYVTIMNFGLGNEIAVINGTRLAANVAVGVGPMGLLFDPSNGYMYASNNGGNTVSVLDGITNVANVSLGFRPFGGVYNPSTGLVYYPDQDSNAVSVINGTKVVGNVLTGPRPTYSLYDPSNGLIYVSDSGFTGICFGCQYQPSDVVSLVLGTSFVENVTVGYGPGPMIYDAGRKSVDVLVGNGVSEISPSNSSTTSTTNFGFAPSLQISGNAFNASVSSPLRVTFNVTTYQPGTLHWFIANGTGGTAFLTYLFENESGILLPPGLSVTYPDGTSSSGNKTNVQAILTFSPVAAGKTLPLMIVLSLVPAGDPSHPIGTAETLVVTVGHDQSASSFPWESDELAGIGALVVLVAVGLLWYRKINQSTAHTFQQRLS